MTGAGMMECKKALVEADGDMDKAVDVLRTRGLAAVAKKAGRATNEGTVMAHRFRGRHHRRCRRAQLRDRLRWHEREVQGLRREGRQGCPRRQACRHGRAQGCRRSTARPSRPSLPTASTLWARTPSSLASLSLRAGAVSSYIHMGGKIGVLVSFDVEGVDTASDEFKQYGRDVAMQVAAVRSDRCQPRRRSILPSSSTR